MSAPDNAARPPAAAFYAKCAAFALALAAAMLAGLNLALEREQERAENKLRPALKDSAGATNASRKAWEA